MSSRHYSNPPPVRSVNIASYSAVRQTAHAKSMPSKSQILPLHAHQTSNTLLHRRQQRQYYVSMSQQFIIMLASIVVLVLLLKDFIICAMNTAAIVMALHFYCSILGIKGAFFILHRDRHKLIGLQSTQQALRRARQKASPETPRLSQATS
jgi:hypothetical protein